MMGHSFCPSDDIFLTVSETKKNPTQTRVEMLLKSARSLFANQQVEEAFSDLIQAKKLAEEAGDVDGKIRVLLVLGDLYCKQNLLSEALTVYHWLLDLVQSNQRLDALIRSRIGNIYVALKQYEKALFLYEQALKNAEDGSLLASQIQEYVGNVFTETRFYDKALECYFLSLPIYEQQEKELLLANCYHSIANTFFQMENLEKAEFYVDLALKTVDFQYDDHLQFWSLLLRGKIEQKKKDFQQALMFFREAEQVALEYKQEMVLGELYRNLAECYSEKGDCSQSCGYWEKAFAAQQEWEIRRKKMQMEALQRCSCEQNEQNQHMLTKNRQLRILNDELQEANLVIQQQNQQLHKLNEEKNQVLHSVAHDMRNSLQVVSQAAELIRYRNEPHFDEKTLSKFRLIDKTVQQLIHFASNLLDVARIESEQFALKMEETNLSSLLRKCVESWSLVAQMKMIHMDFDMPETEVRVAIDKDRIWQIANNLISNAIKFTPKHGNVTVHLRSFEYAFLVSISDNGIGIPDEIQPFMFQKFSRAGRLGTDGEPSSGLGLSIVKKLVELHSGRIWFESSQNGTTFYVQVPLKQKL